MAPRRHRDELLVAGVIGRAVAVDGPANTRERIAERRS
jgi:hypothetical protein